MATRGLLKNIVGINRMFRELDTDGSMELDFEEFSLGMSQHCGIELTFDELKMTFHLFDTNGDGQVSIAEFLFAVLPPLSPHRKRYVDATFASFRLSDREEGTIPVEAIYNRIDMAFHPQVLRGVKSKTEMYREFLTCFEDGNTFE